MDNDARRIAAALVRITYFRPEHTARGGAWRAIAATSARVSFGVGSFTIAASYARSTESKSDLIPVPTCAEI